MPKSKFTAEEKYNILSKYQKGILSVSQISIKYNIHRSRIYEWKRLFDTNGFKGLQDKRGKRKAIETLTHEEKLELKIKQLLH